MYKYSDEYYLEILSVRVQNKTWEEVAEITHHRKANAAKAIKWLEAQPWPKVRLFPEEIQKLRSDYLECKTNDLEAWYKNKSPLDARCGTVVLPAEKTIVYHGLGKKPEFIGLQVLEGPVISDVICGESNENYFEARAVTSGPITAFAAISMNTSPQSNGCITIEEY